MSDRLPTGVPGLDPIVGGGLIPEALYLVKGAPGTGKTTIGLQFLIEGARRGEKCLYLGLSETRGQLHAIAASFDWSLEGIEIHDMRRRGQTDQKRAGYTVFSPSEVELEEIAREILEQVDRVRPTRLVLDSLSEIRLLAEDAFRYRREVLTLSDQITQRRCTGLLIDVEAEGNQGAVAETLVNGVIVLEQLSPEYGGDRRRLRVRKLRASASIGGYHDMVLTHGGVQIFPRLIAASHRAKHSSVEVKSGIEALDALLGGGIDRGTSTVLMGPAGSGKSTVAAQFVTQAAIRGERSVILCFDESPTNLQIRTKSLGIPLQTYVDEGVVQLVAVDPGERADGAAELDHQDRLAHRLHRRRVHDVRVFLVLPGQPAVEHARRAGGQGRTVMPRPYVQPVSRTSAALRRAARCLARFTCSPSTRRSSAGNLPSAR